MRSFNPYQREHNLLWSIPQIKWLIECAIKNKSTTFISYAAIECRMIIERLEYSIVIGGAGDKFEQNDLEIISRFKGIQRANEKYKVLKFRYQSFSEAFAIAVLENSTFKLFPFKEAEEIQYNLSQYIHLYSRSNIELEYESEFMQSGIKIVKDTITFLENYDDIGTLNFHTLKNGFEIEFSEWINTKNEDVEALTKRLKIIASKFSNDNYIL